MRHGEAPFVTLGTCTSLGVFASAARRLNEFE
jgi:hypothetical protein